MLCHPDLKDNQKFTVGFYIDFQNIKDSTANGRRLDADLFRF